MDLQTLKQQVKEKYIENPFALANSLGIKEEKEVLDFLMLVYEYNQSLIQKEERSLSILKQREAESKIPILINDIKKGPTKASIEEEIPLSAKAKEILALLEIAEVDDVDSLLPSKESTTFDATLNQVMYYYYQDIVFLNRCLMDPTLTVKEEEKQELQKELNRKRALFEQLKKSRSTVKEEKIQVQKEPLTLIHLETSTHESYLQKDLEALPMELYPHFLKIIIPFMNGQAVCSHAMNNSSYRNLVVVKNQVHQARLYVVHLTGNMHLVLGAMNKKQYWGKQEKNFLDIRYKTYMMNLGKILDCLEDDRFIEQNKAKTEKILTLLKGGK